MMSYLDATCFFYIRERTKNEYVSIGSNGNILRWSYTGGDEQKWLIIPTDDGSCKFMTRQNGEFMSVGSNGNILRWGDGGSNEFRIVNEQPDGWFNIQEPTKNEYVAVGSNGNILRWARTGGADQQFKLEPVDIIMPQPSLKKDEHWYYPSQIPNPPELKGFDNDPPLKSQRYYISGQVLPAVLVNDPRYPDKLRQVEGSPYYTLKRYQQWSRSEAEGHGNLKTFTGASEHIMDVTIKTGMTTTQRNEVERVVGWNLAIQLKGSVSGGKGVTGGGEVGLQVGYSDTTTTRQWTETTITNEKVVREQETYPPQNGRFRVAVWSLLDVYTLTDNQGKLVKEWSVIQEPAKHKTLYPSRA